MTEQLELDAGQQDAVNHLGKYAAQFVEDVILELAKRGAPFTSDDAWKGLAYSPTFDSLRTAPNALGGIMRRMAQRGLIAKTGRYVKSVQPDAKGHIIAEWRGVP